MRSLSQVNVWKIADFSINSEGNLLVIKYGRGSANYRAPEVLLAKVNEPSYNNTIDVWGLGCILYELCTGEKAFPGQHSVLSYGSGQLPLPQVSSFNSNEFLSQNQRQLDDTEFKNVRETWLWDCLM